VARFPDAVHVHIRLDVNGLLRDEVAGRPWLQVRDDLGDIVDLLDGHVAGLGDRIELAALEVAKMMVQHDFGAFASKIRTVQRNGVRVEHNMSEWFLPYFLLSLYKNEMKDRHDTLVLTPKSFKIPAKEEARWVLLMGIRGVGPHLAKTLLTHFGSIRAIAEASEEDLKQVKGVGKKLAEQIVWYMG